MKNKILKILSFFILKLFFIGDWRRVHAPAPGPTQCTRPHRGHWEQVQNQRQQYQVQLGLDSVYKYYYFGNSLQVHFGDNLQTYQVQHVYKYNTMRYSECVSNNKSSLYTLTMDTSYRDLRYSIGIVYINIKFTLGWEF